jgi:hypothetical protein
MSTAVSGYESPSGRQMYIQPSTPDCARTSSKLQRSPSVLGPSIARSVLFSEPSPQSHAKSQFATPPASPLRWDTIWKGTLAVVNGDKNETAFDGVDARSFAKLVAMADKGEDGVEGLRYVLLNSFSFNIYT